MKVIVLPFLISFSLAACSAGKQSVESGAPQIRISGSETLHPLTSRWAEDYMSVHPGVSIEVSGGGTKYGLKSLIDGRAEIAATSRPLKPEEVKRLADIQKGVGISFLVAKDAITIYVNMNNPISDLTVTQIRDIFSGKITNWKEVGGIDTVIQVFSRPPNSGTFLYFQEHVLLGKEYAENAIVIPTVELMAEVVSKSRHGIGYGTITHKFPSKNIQVNGIEPNEETVRNEKYPLTRYLYLVVPNTPEPWVMDFIGWVQSEAGQVIVRENGYIPLW